MQMRPDEWHKLYDLRDDLDGEDYTLMRRTIKYIEYLEREVRARKDELHKARNQGANHDD